MCCGDTGEPQNVSFSCLFLKRYRRFRLALEICQTKKGVQPGGERGVALLNHPVWDCLCGLMCHLLPSALQALIPLNALVLGSFNSLEE